MPLRVEWPTLIMMGLTYAGWGLGTTVLWAVSPVLAVCVVTVALAQYSSLQHEVLHGHPFRSPVLNEALVFAGLTVVFPYRRFRDTHLAHHHDPALTDPYDDPESNYLDPAVWARLGPVARALLRANNTLLGRIVLGPAIGTVVFVKNDMRLALAGDRGVQVAWALHGLGLGLLGLWLALVAQMPVWAYLLAAYGGLGLLKIRTFLEHRAHESARARTAIVEDRGPLSYLFLNNNFHAVHHSHPQVPWYQLPALYAANRAHFLRRNDGYRYASYAEVFRSHLLTAKDPVPHPLWPEAEDQAMRRNVGTAPELSKNGTPG